MRLPDDQVGVERQTLGAWFDIMFKIYWNLQAGHPVPPDHVQTLLDAVNEVGRSSKADAIIPGKEPAPFLETRTEAELAALSRDLPF